MRIRHSVAFAAPLAIVYQLFRQPEELPRILGSVLEVTPEEPNGIRYRVMLGKGGRVRLDAELIEATHDRCIAWTHLDGPLESGRIEFVAIDASTTRLDLELVERKGERRNAAGIRREVVAELAALQALLARVAADSRSPASEISLGPPS